MFGGVLTERVNLIDPVVVEGSPATRRRPVPSPPKKPLTVSPPIPTRGREHEVQRLIRDLAVLAATHKQSAP